MDKKLLVSITGRNKRDWQDKIKEINKYLSMTKEQKQVYSLIQRTYPGMRPVDVVQDEKIMESLRKDIEDLEKEEGGFVNYIRMLMARQLPQPQTDCWLK